MRMFTNKTNKENTTMKELLTSKEACKKLKICRNTLMKYDRPGITVRIGRAVRYDEDALMKAIMAEQENR